MLGCELVISQLNLYGCEATYSMYLLCTPYILYIAHPVPSREGVELMDLYGVSDAGVSTDFFATGRHGTNQLLANP